MLVLTRKIGEAICLPEQKVTIRVVRIQGRQVRLGIEAPVKVPIRRSELEASPAVALRPECPAGS